MLSRGAGEWRLIEPIDAPISDEIAARLTGLVDAPFDVDLMRERRLTGEALDVESTELRVALGASGAEWELLVGRAGRRVSQVPTTWIAMSEGDTVYRVREDLRGLFERDPEAYRSLRLVDLERDAVTTVTLIDRDSMFVVRREGTRWQAEDGTLIDEAAVRRLVLSVARLRAVGIADVTRAAAGLSTPQFAVRLQTANEVATVYLGSQAGDDEWYAIREGEPTIFRLSRAASRFVDTRQTDLATPYATEIPPDDVVRIEGAHTWRRGPCDEACEAGAPRPYIAVDGQTAAPEDAGAVRAALQAIASLRVVRWVDAPPPSAVPALSRLTLERESGDRVTLEVGPAFGNDGSPLDPDDRLARLNHERWFRISQRHAAPILALAVTPATTQQNDPPSNAQTE